MKKQIASFKKVGYLEKIPEHHNKSEYDTITISKNQITKQYYRKRSNKKKYNEITNFNKAIEKYNEHLK